MSVSSSGDPGNQGDPVDHHSPLAITPQALVELQAFHTRISFLQEIAAAITRRLSLDEILLEVGRRVKW